MEKLPSKSVMVPVAVPLTTTEAPGSGKLVSSVTVPWIVFCANSINGNKNVNKNSCLVYFIIIWFL